MITINDKQYRNLEEQVLKNQEDIHDLQVTTASLNAFGITVVEVFGTLGAFNNWADANTEHNYGDAVLVGAEPFDMYIWTRANEENPRDYWMNIGQFPLEGPQGEQGQPGIQGIQGIRGTRWYTFTSPNTPPINSSILEGDIAIDTVSGDMYIYQGGNMWNYFTTIRGAQGIRGQQGIQGIQGPAGPEGPRGQEGAPSNYLRIAGVVSSVDQLPSIPSLNDLSIAYLIGAANSYHLAIQVGRADDLTNAMWVDVGQFNYASTVSVNGAFQYVWNADTKVDKVNTANIVYGTNVSGNQTMYKIGTGITYNAIPVRKNDGNIQVPSMPQDTYDATSKKYVDDTVNNYVPSEVQIRMRSNGTPQNYIIAINPTADVSYGTGYITIVPESVIGG